MARVELRFSKSKVNTAGTIYRRHALGELVRQDELEWADEVLNNFRAAHDYPMLKASMGLRSMVKTTECADPQVSQRLKRKPTIIDKLKREPDMMLARMQDIGGTRAVLSSVDEVRAVAARLHRTRRIVRVKDYIETPAISGYRSLHVVVKYDDRSIEVQLRTQVQHDWAVTVERLGWRLDQDLKSGEGPDEIHEFLKAVSRAMELEEAGEMVDDEMQGELSTLRTAAEPFLHLGSP